MKKLIALVSSAVLSGCATNYDGYAEANVKIAQARAQAEGERYKAMAAIAATGDSAAKVAAVMSMVLGQPNQAQQQLSPPKSAADTTLQAIATILPSIASIYGINRQVALGIEQVRGNSANVASTNNAFVGIAGQIKSNNTTTTTTTDNTHTPTVVQVDPLIVRPEVVKPVVIQSGQ
jgi:hypothetical protein